MDKDNLNKEEMLEAIKEGTRNAVMKSISKTENSSGDNWFYFAVKDGVKEAMLELKGKSITD